MPLNKEKPNHNILAGFTSVLDLIEHLRFYLVWVYQP